MQFKSLGLAAELRAASAGPALAQINEHMLKVGTGLGEDHPQTRARAPAPAPALTYFRRTIGGPERRQAGDDHSRQSHAGVAGQALSRFDFGIVKTLVISQRFRELYLNRPGHEGVFEARAVVSDGADDHHARIEGPALDTDDGCIRVTRGAGSIGWPGSAEVVHMQPPDATWP